MSSTAPQARPAVMAIDPYVPGKSKGTGSGPVIKLSSNESPLGPSPEALEAFREAAGSLELYPDGAASALREAIAGRYGLDAARIVCGCGSDDLLHLIAQAYIGPGDEAVITEHGFLVYKIAVQAAGGTAVVAAERDRTGDVAAILAKVGPKTKIVFIANPNNPTGTYLAFDEVRRLHAALPSDVLLVLDAAYAEYVAANDYSSGLELAATSENVVMTRTFSKIHGLAALRLGWCYGPPAFCDAINRIRGPFNVNGPALAAGIAAMRDTAHVDRAAAHNAQWLPWVAAEVTRLGLDVTPSVGNFLLIDFPAEAGRTAADADAFLSAHGIVLRQVTAYGLPHSLRMTIGEEDANRRAVAALAAFMGQAHP